MTNVDKVGLKSGNSSTVESTPAKTTEYNKINPFITTQLKTYADSKVNFGLFNQDPNLPDDSFKGRSKESKNANIFGNIIDSQLGSKGKEALNLERLAPLQADKFGTGNPIEKEKKIVLGQFLSALLPKKTVIGQIPTESELVDTIGQLYEMSPKFKQILDEIEYRGVK